MGNPDPILFLESQPMPRTAQFIQSVAVIAATTSGALLTAISIKKKDSVAEHAFKILLSLGLLVIGTSAALYEFKYRFDTPETQV